MNKKKVWSRRRKETLIDIGAYCLMTNHFHILVREKEEGGIGKFMQKFSTAYVMYFNKLHERTGGLFEGTYKYKHVSNDNYLEHLYAYIHINPLDIKFPDWKETGSIDKATATNFLRNYRYSSYLDYADNAPRQEGKILNKLAFPKYFSDQVDFRTFVELATRLDLVQ